MATYNSHTQNSDTLHIVGVTSVGRRTKKYLFQAAELGREMVAKKIPTEKIAEMHELALKQLGKTLPETKLLEAASRISAPLMEMLMAYGLAFRERLEKRKQAEEALRESEERFRAVVDTANDAIITIDSRGNIVGWNNGAQVMFGYSVDEINGQSLTLIMPERYREDHQSGLRRVTSGGAPKVIGKTVELAGLRKEGGEFPLELSMAAWKTGEEVFFTAVVRDVTERKLAEEELRLREQQLSLIYDSTGDILYYLKVEPGPHYRFLTVNRAGLKAIGLTVEQIVGKTINEVIPEPSLKLVRSNYKKAIREKRIVYWEETSQYPAGLKTGIVSIAPVFDDKGICTHLVGSVHDITERKRVEEALRESEERTRLLLEAAFEGIVISENGKILEANQAFADMFGYPFEEIIGLSPIEMTTPKSSKKIAEHIAIGYEKLYEFVGLKKDGTLFDIEVVGKNCTYRGRDARITAMRDITERKRAEEALREGEERFRSLIESTSDGIIISEQSGNMTLWNKAAQNMFGYRADEIIGKQITEIMPESYRPHHHESMQRLVKTGKAKHIGKTLELEGLRKDGSVFPLELSLSTWHTQGMRFFSAITRDITKRKQREEKLKTLNTAIEQSPASVVITDTHGNIEYVNPKFTQISGYSSEEVVGKNPRILKSGETPPEEYEKLWKTITAGGEWRGVFHNRKKSGEFYWESASISAVKNSAGSITHFLAIKEDITARKQAEEKQRQLEAQLHQAQKMETLGTLAGGIAHDFNNILQAIQGYADMSLDEVPPKSQAHDDLQEVMKATNRGQEIVQQILAFSRREANEPRPLRLHLVVREVLNLLKVTLPTTIDLRQDLKRKCGTVLADPGQIHQVVMNLCTNAFQAMHKNGGVLTVSLEKVVSDDEFLQSHPKLNEQEYIQLTVSDTGEGMDQRTMARIFEPFFTTKDVGDGTGLGLSVVHGIIMSHNGDITVESEPGKGATFRVYLPLIERVAKPVRKRDEKIAGGHERILLVDDQEVVVSVMKRLLQRSGYEVTTRNSSAETLEMFGANPDSFDLVITDQNLPKMTGMKLAGELLNIRPDLPIILMSGFAEDVTDESAKAGGIKEFIQKPVDADDLSKAVRRVMDEKQKR